MFFLLVQAEINPHPALGLVYPALAVAPWMGGVLLSGLLAGREPPLVRGLLSGLAGQGRGSAPPWIPSPGAQSLSCMTGVP